MIKYFSRRQKRITLDENKVIPLCNQMISFSKQGIVLIKLYPNYAVDYADQ